MSSRQKWFLFAAAVGSLCILYAPELPSPYPWMALGAALVVGGFVGCCKKEPGSKAEKKHPPDPKADRHRRR